MRFPSDSPPVMRLSWDPRTSARTLLKRGFDLEFASNIFTARTVEIADARHDGAPPRRLATGMAEGIPLTVLYAELTDLDGTPRRHLIAARQALTAESDAHRAPRPSA